MQLESDGEITTKQRYSDTTKNNIHENCLLLVSIIFKACDAHLSKFILRDHRPNIAKTMENCACGLIHKVSSNHDRKLEQIKTRALSHPSDRKQTNNPENIFGLVDEATDARLH